MEDARKKVSRAFGARTLEEGFARVVFHDDAAVHEQHAVGHALGETHFVRDAQHGHVRPARAWSSRRRTPLTISGSSAEVGSSNSMATRVHRKRPCNCHARAADRQTMRRILVLMTAQTHTAQQRTGALGGFAARAAEHVHLREHQVALHREGEEEFEMLKHHTDARP